MALNDQDRQILDFEESWWTRPEAKASGIRYRLGMSPTQYYRRLADLADSGDRPRASPPSSSAVSGASATNAGAVTRRPPNASTPADERRPDHTGWPRRPPHDGSGATRWDPAVEGWPSRSWPS